MKALQGILGRIILGLSASFLMLGYLLAPSAAFAATPPPVCFITVNPTSIPVGGSVTVKWSSTNATNGAITNIGNVGPSGSINLLPSSAARTTYLGSFTGPGGTANCQASVAVVISGGTGDSGSTATVPPTVVTPAPTLSEPQIVGSGLVPCGYGKFDPATNSRSSSTGCQACDLATLIQNLINFAIGLSIPIAAALFAWAGVLFFTSADSPGRRDEAKKIFKNAFIGFLIAITAWIVINTVLHVIFNQGPFSGGNWFTIQCSTNRPVNNSITSVISNLPIVGGGSIGTGGYPDYGSNAGVSGGETIGTQGGGGNGVYSCPSGSRLTVVNAGDDANEYNICSGADGAELAVQCNSSAGYHLANTSDINSNSYSGECANQNNQIVDYSPPVTGSGLIGNTGAGTTQWSSQLAQACQNANLSDCRLAQAIMANESSGRQGVISGVGAAGLMQVMPDTARGLDPANLSGLSNAQITQRLVNDPAYNMQLGTQYIAQLSNQFGGDPALVAAAYNGGPGANRTSATCGGGTYWQCTANSGYAETRVYVPRVLSTYNALR